MSERARWAETLRHHAARTDTEAALVRATQRAEETDAELQSVWHTQDHTIAALEAENARLGDARVLAEARCDTAKDAYEALRTACGFFVSVIKSGEPWSPKCQAMYDAAWAGAL